ncbi:MAG: polysaccharide deacetylase family protein [Chthoniobacterales bacterium]
MQRALVVSIHDVAPATRSRVEKILAQLLEHEVSACSLLVVPDYHHQGRSLADPGFREWLHELEGRGHEIVIHGFFHQRVRRSEESTGAKLITRFYTADEGEFFDLGYDEALRLISEAQNDFATHGFHPQGFIAPAWLLGEEAARAALDAGLTYTTTLRTVRDFVAGRTIASQSLVYSVRSGWRRTMSLAWNRSLSRRLAPNPLLRLGIHPPDLDHPAIWRQITTLIDEALLSRRAMTYQSWLNERSAFSNRQPAIR